MGRESCTYLSFLLHTEFNRYFLNSGNSSNFGWPHSLALSVFEGALFSGLHHSSAYMYVYCFQTASRELIPYAFSVFPWAQAFLRYTLPWLYVSLAVYTGCRIDARYQLRSYCPHVHVHVHVPCVYVVGIFKCLSIGNEIISRQKFLVATSSLASLTSQTLAFLQSQSLPVSIIL